MIEQKTPFEKAEENIRKFAENTEMMHNLFELKKLLDDVGSLTPEEREGVEMVIEKTLKHLSSYLIRTGGKWN
tara:strand:+ start:324 stop:542 length:219 start_codon:yes stop_codon:yes gene_type:complete